MIEKETGVGIAPNGVAVQGCRETIADGFLAARLMPVARICLLLSLCGSGYLAWVSLTGGAVAGCGPGSGCNQVLASRWAYWLGLPVSLPAFACYLCVLVTSFGVPKFNRFTAQFLQAALAGLVIFAATWFVLLQLLVIKSWCKFCLATHICAAVAVGLLLFPSIKRLAESKREHSSTAPIAHQLLIGMLAGLLGLVLLVVGQIIVEKRLYLVTTFSGQFISSANQVSLHGGRFTLLPDELPRIGVPSATNFVVSLFDYTCKHCRELHPLLKEAELRYRGRLSVISLPMPLESTCNPVLKRTAPENSNACEYARLSLAVWRTSPKAFLEFDDWLFSGPKPPPLEETRAKAYAVAGKERVNRALKSAWVARQLQTDVSLYVANARSIRDARLPQLVIGNVITHGAINGLREVLNLLEQHTSLGSPASSALFNAK